MTNYFVISCILIIITSVPLGLLTYWKNKRSLTNRLFFVLTLVTSFWALGISVVVTVNNKQLALFLAHFFHFGVIFIPILYTHFILSLLNINLIEKKVIRFSYALGIFFSFSNLTNFFIKDVRSIPEFNFNFFIQPGYLYLPFLVMFFLLPGYAFIKSLLVFRNSVGVKRNQIKYIIMASCFAFVGGSSTYFPAYNINIYPYANFLVPVYPMILAYAITHYRLMDIRVAFTRAGIFLVVYTIVLSMPFIVLHRTGSGLIATSLAVIFATLGPLIYRFLQKKAESVILNQQRHYQRILLQAAMGMVTEHNLEKLSKLIVFILIRTIKLNFATIFINEKGSDYYESKAMRSKTVMEACSISFSLDHSFVCYLKKNHDPFFFEEMPVQIRESFDSSLNVSMIIPVFSGNALLGFVLLGEKTNTQAYTKEDINVFKILSRQAALAIENCIFFKESQESQERIFAAEKLASIGGMADGVAHQIKNRLNQFSLASGELKNEIDNFNTKYPELIKKDPELKRIFDYLTKISLSLIENVKRTDNIIKGILDFSKVENKENFFNKFSLKEVTDLAASLLMIKHEVGQLPIIIDLGKDDVIYGIKSQIIEAVYNMLDNAYEATKEMQVQLSKKEQEQFLPFSPKVEFSLTHTQDRYLIKISDNGIGIKEEDKHKIFAPFFTTKSSYKSGSGIGAYVVKRIIEENHKGKIWFVSTYMKGTSFFIELPEGK